ncbi:MAG: amidase family protein [Methylophilaceae bacterium]|uniref:amidase family protein n=1 Tax=Methylicorpusculum sp. TaxID=2713644 RepID=UPI00272F3CF0|nr:amidase family protein [Methylicorpusculum sp.]MDP2180532.1 amidase family protein [Methylicorpusculum sp.]MDP3529686.1 amidase family protein [Methylicorpusculum sp.]MDZ4099118.1 amidase family protein [Methylophilaceae bacterium]
MPIAKTAIVIKTVVSTTVPDSEESIGEGSSILSKQLTASSCLEKKPPITAQTAVRRLLAASVCLLTLYDAPIAAAVLDLEKLDGPTAIKMLEDGKLTSVELTKAYIKRIEALNKRGPGLNAVTQFNKDALRDAALLDKERAQGHVRGPAHGLPILLKDLIDAKGMYTSAGNYSLRDSFPESDSGVVKKLRESGVVILGKLGLSEFANSFGNQPSGFSNLTGQVLHALDADQNPSGSSSGSGTAGAAALSMLTIGTETSGSIISPATAQSLVGIRPTVGLVPAYGIAPISASQDTAGPMTKTVAEAAMTLQSIVGFDPVSDAAYESVFGPNWFESITRVPDQLPDYMSALRMDFVQGKRIGYNGTFADGSPAKIAFDALVAAGAIMVERPQIAVGTVPGLPAGYQQHKSINEYYKNLGPSAPIQSLAEEVADNIANSQEALKFGHINHVNALNNGDVTPGGPQEIAYRAAMPIRRAAQWAAINRMMNNDTPDDPSDDFIAILGTVPSGATAGTPQITIPMGYNLTNRRAIGLSIHGNANSERDLIGVAYVIEQSTQLRQTASELNPSMYRCAKTVPLPSFHERGSCNPDYESLKGMVKTAPKLPFSLETESVESLQARMTAGTLTAQQLTRAYLARIALTNAEGPAIQAVREVNLGALGEAGRLDAERKRGKLRGPLHGIPVLLDDVIDVSGMPTTAGSIALQHALPAKDSMIVAKLKAAGAIILGKTNVTELNGIFDQNLPEGYSSLGGQVLMPSDTDKTPGGSSAGSAAATATGLAAMTVGMETSTDSAQIIAPAGIAGVVALKPTVGLVSRTGVLPVAKSQDSPGPITRTVYDAATALGVLAGIDPVDDATSEIPDVPDYLSGLSPAALSGKRIAVISSTAAPYPAVVSALQGLGATVVVKSIGTPNPNPDSIVTREFKRDLNSYLSTLQGSGAKSLQAIIDYNDANPVEGLKYQQRELLSAQEVNLSDPAVNSIYESEKVLGQVSSQALIDTILTNGTPDDVTDDFVAIVVPNGNTLVGIADRAGYPVLTVPAGYGTGGAGRNPIGVSFVGTAFSEDKLLAAGYAFEQATNVRLAPSFTNPSMWRCVAGSTFYSPYKCHPGDLESERVF